jgi:aminopeptidase
MPVPGLNEHDLANLVRSVFPGHPEDRSLAILVDLPRARAGDNAGWKARRAMAAEWASLLTKAAPEVPLDRVRLIAYPDVGSNNADLPAEATVAAANLPADASGLSGAGSPVTFESVFRETALFLAPTEYSTTAPLKNAAARYGFRAATMPGFNDSMVPALRVDYGEVGRRVALIKDRLDRADEAEIEFIKDGIEPHRMIFDLRHRAAHESSGRFPKKGTAGNLPSGEAYIVPYEGEQGPASRTRGELPVEIEGEVLVFAVEANRAIAVRPAATLGPAWKDEADRLHREPAYGNMAELGFGVLGDFGLSPVGEILLDEKLGLHVAFGRSDHFGGQVGPAAFSSPSEVVHIDRIYIPATQPRVAVYSVVLRYPDRGEEVLMSEGRYKIF